MAVQPEDLLVFSAGPLRLRPQWVTSASFDDNILYRSSKDARGDGIFMVSPGLDAEFGTKEKQFNASFNYDFQRYDYVDNGSLGHTDHLLGLKAAVNLDRWSVDASASASRFTGILGGSSSLNQLGGLNNLGAKVDRWVIRDDFRTGYIFSEKFATYLEGHYDSTDYQTGVALFDQNSLRGTLGAAYQAFSKISLFAESYYGQIASNPNFATPKPPHLDLVGGYLGAKGEFTPKISGSLQAGYEHRTFSSGAPIPGVPVVVASLDYAATEKFKAGLSYSRSTGVSVESVGNAYTSDSIGLHLAQKLGTRDKWMATFDATYREDGYDSQGVAQVRDDTYYSLGLRLTYQAQLWFKTSLAYTRESYATSVTGLVDYDVNRVLFEISVGY